mgnify:CR=1 FL=1
MIFKNYINKIGDFIIKRLAELIGIFLIVTSILLFISLISYSPEDPNFIFPENQEIKNFLGFRGSFVADIFFQSIGIISLLIPFSLLLFLQIYPESNIFDTYPALAAAASAFLFFASTFFNSSFRFFWDITFTSFRDMKPTSLSSSSP